MNNMQEQSMQMSQNEQDDVIQSIQQQQQNLAAESNNRMYAIAEHLQNPISTRYDDIYHPRTDKRVISKLTSLFFTFNFSIFLFTSRFFSTTVITFISIFQRVTNTHTPETSTNNTSPKETRLKNASPKSSLTSLKAVAQLNLQIFFQEPK